MIFWSSIEFKVEEHRLSFLLLKIKLMIEKCNMYVYFWVSFELFYFFIAKIQPEKHKKSSLMLFIPLVMAFTAEAVHMSKQNYYSTQSRYQQKAVIKSLATSDNVLGILYKRHNSCEFPFSAFLHTKTLLNSGLI